ncbi:MAG: hypothetical protein JEZ10_04900, partial [Verrucomicrobia bacterium]|nr:hypothetical protein [Verrucomicrobiota bacterium]
MSPPILRIINLKRTVQNGICRVSADVGGEKVWYESDSTELLASPEIFASAFLVPAMAAGAGLCVDGDLSKVWKNNIRKLMELFHSWWGYPVVGIEAGDAPESLLAGGRTALFFSGGVDSFYSLLRGEHPVDDLVYVHGFDVPLDGEQRFAEVRAHLETVAASAGKRLLMLRTNLRQHPLIQKVGWGRAHGGALASIAYCLPETGRVVISSSYSRMISRPWGSHWEADPLWSSERLEILHLGDRVFRSDKLRAIADEPLVQQHLRVCWKNRGDHLNCCCCEKCIRTMLVLEGCRKLDPYDVFPLRHHLARMVRRLRYVPDEVIPTYHEFVRS